VGDLASSECFQAEYRGRGPSVLPVGFEYVEKGRKVPASLLETAPGRLMLQTGYVRWKLVCCERQTALVELTLKARPREDTRAVCKDGNIRKRSLGGLLLLSLLWINQTRILLDNGEELFLNKVRDLLLMSLLGDDLEPGDVWLVENFQDLALHRWSVEGNSRFPTACLLRGGQPALPAQPN